MATEGVKDLSFLGECLPSFSGDKTEYYHFVVKCDNTVAMADDSVKHLLLNLIHNKLSSPVCLRIRNQTFKSWKELKLALDAHYLEKKVMYN